MANQATVSRRSIVSAATALGAGFLVQGPNASGAALMQSTPVSTAARIAAPAWFVTLHQLLDPYPGVIQAPAQPPAGTRYVAAEVQIDNDSDQALNFTPADLRLRDGTGFEYRGGTAIGEEPMLNARNLNGGERSRGWVWFTVTADARLSELVYTAPAPQFRIGLA